MQASSNSGSGLGAWLWGASSPGASNEENQPQGESHPSSETTSWIPSGLQFTAELFYGAAQSTFTTIGNVVGAVLESTVPYDEGDTASLSDHHLAVVEDSGTAIKEHEPEHEGVGLNPDLPGERSNTTLQGQDIQTQSDEVVIESFHQEEAFQPEHQNERGGIEPRERSATEATGTIPTGRVKFAELKVRLRELIRRICDIARNLFSRSEASEDVERARSPSKLEVGRNMSEAMVETSSGVEVRMRSIMYNSVFNLLSSGTLKGSLKSADVETTSLTTAVQDVSFKTLEHSLKQINMIYSEHPNADEATLLEELKLLNGGHLPVADLSREDLQLLSEKWQLIQPYKFTSDAIDALDKKLSKLKGQEALDALGKRERLVKLSKLESKMKDAEMKFIEPIAEMLYQHMIKNKLVTLSPMLPGSLIKSEIAKHIYLFINKLSDPNKLNAAIVAMDPARFLPSEATMIEAAQTLVTGTPQLFTDAQIKSIIQIDLYSQLETDQEKLNFISTRLIEEKRKVDPNFELDDAASNKLNEQIKHAVFEDKVVSFIKLQGKEFEVKTLSEQYEQIAAQFGTGRKGKTLSDEQKKIVLNLLQIRKTPDPTSLGVELTRFAFPTLGNVAKSAQTYLPESFRGVVRGGLQAVHEEVLRQVIHEGAMTNFDPRQVIGPIVAPNIRDPEELSSSARTKLRADVVETARNLPVTQMLRPAAQAAADRVGVRGAYDFGVSVASAGLAFAARIPGVNALATSAGNAIQSAALNTLGDGIDQAFDRLQHHQVNKVVMYQIFQAAAQAIVKEF